MEQIISREVLDTICADTVTALNEKSVSRQSTSTSITRILKPISYSEFYHDYLYKNRPCILSEWATASWKSLKDWRTEKSDGFKPNFKKLLELFGDNQVPVADCRNREFNSHVKLDIKFKDFITYWRDRMNGNHDNRLLYLKDWHFTREHPSYKAYDTPQYFTSDWLNEMFDEKVDSFTDDFRFVYMGPAGTWTPFHADVYRSYSWSANICGKKLWLLFPPGHEEKLKDINGHLPYDVRDVISDDVMKPIEVEQVAGEVIFVPSGWHHQVCNLEDTISINHNWFNGCCVNQVWSFLQSELRLVEHEIEDCRSLMEPQEWADQCQVLLKCNSGIDFEQFHTMLCCVVNTRCDVIIPQRPTIHAESIEYDIIKKRCIECMTSLRPCLASVKTGESQAVADLCLVMPTLLDFSKRTEYNCSVLSCICDVMVTFIKQNTAR